MVPSFLSIPLHNKRLQSIIFACFHFRKEQEGLSLAVSVPGGLGQALLVKRTLNYTVSDSASKHNLTELLILSLASHSLGHTEMLSGTF